LFIIFIYRIKIDIILIYLMNKMKEVTFSEINEVREYELSIEEKMDKKKHIES